MKMVVFSKWGQISVTARSMALLSVEPIYLESPKVPKAALAVENKEVKCDIEKTVEQKQQEAKAAAQRSKVPKIAPQFNGLNFYETFIGTAQR